MSARQDSAQPQDVINGRLYSCASTVRQYTSIHLSPPEATALVRYRDDIMNRRVLDLGCGAGRLAVFLRPFTPHYVGLDVSPHMVTHCRQNLPELRFEQGDMRELKMFENRSFDVVFAVFNLFDAVGHEDRVRCFAEVRRVLAPGGLLVFSTHNRNSTRIAQGPHLEYSRNPVTQLRCVVDYVRSRSNHRRIKPHQRFESDYAIVNDAGHNFSVLHYYISRAAQIKQLVETGFQPLECLDELGRTLGPDDNDAACCSLHHVARTSPDR